MPNKAADMWTLTTVVREANNKAVDEARKALLVSVGHAAAAKMPMVLGQIHARAEAGFATAHISHAFIMEMFAEFDGLFSREMVASVSTHLREEGFTVTHNREAETLEVSWTNVSAA